MRAASSRWLFRLRAQQAQAGARTRGQRAEGLAGKIERRREVSEMIMAGGWLEGGSVPSFRGGVYNSYQGHHRVIHNAKKCRPFAFMRPNFGHMYVVVFLEEQRFR